mgnify:CR=1 FL=1
MFGDSSGEVEGEKVRDTFNENWSWFGTMYRLASGDITQLERITKTSLYECLTWLTYETELQEQTNFNNTANE